MRVIGIVIVIVIAVVIEITPVTAMNENVHLET